MAQASGVTPRLLRTKDAARYLGMKPCKIRKLNLPYINDGGPWLYDVRDLDGWIEANKQTE